MKYRQIMKQVDKAGWDAGVVASIEKATDAGDGELLLLLADLAASGLIDDKGNALVARNAARSAELYRRAAKAGNATAYTRLADELTAVGGSKKDRVEGIKLYKRAFALGDASAAHNLAVAYQNAGEFSSAVSWFRKAEKGGDANALLPLARAELYGVGTRRDGKSAVARLAKLAKRAEHQSERAEAMLLLADVYLNGWLVVRDYDAAIGWLQKAAAEGSVEAQARLTEEGL